MSRMTTHCYHFIIGESPQPTYHGTIQHGTIQCGITQEGQQDQVTAHSGSPQPRGLLT